MEIRKEIRDALKERVKNVSGLALQVRSDFDILSMKMKSMTDVSLSSTTLRRFFGYQETLEELGYSISTLNAICQYVGYRNVEAFEKSLTAGEGSASDFIECLQQLVSKELERGMRVRVAWAPDRNMVVRYEGTGEVFMVEECVNGKLMAGDTFHAHQFVQGEPLYCKFVLRKGMAPIDYVCGRNGGIRFTLLD